MAAKEQVGRPSSRAPSLVLSSVGLWKTHWRLFLFLDLVVSLGPGTGVCYDFQNKGVCQRGRFCHFSHCACNSTCSCTSTKNTYGTAVDVVVVGRGRCE